MHKSNKDKCSDRLFKQAIRLLIGKLSTETREVLYSVQVRGLRGGGEFGNISMEISISFAFVC